MGDSRKRHGMTNSSTELPYLHRQLSGLRGDSYAQLAKRRRSDSDNSNLWFMGHSATPYWTTATSQRASLTLATLQSTKIIGNSATRWFNTFADAAITIGPTSLSVPAPSLSYIFAESWCCLQSPSSANDALVYSTNLRNSARAMRRLPTSVQ